MIRISMETPSIEILQQMEDVHPESIRWDVHMKEAHLDGLCTFGYWLYEDNVCVGEYIASGIDDGTFYGESISVLPEYSGKGYAKLLTEYALEDACVMGFNRYIGEARPGASWHIVQSLGAIQTGVSVNHGGTGEDYIAFCLELK